MRFLCDTPGCENVSNSIFGKMANLEVSLFGQPLDKRVYKPKGNIQVPCQISLAGSTAIINLFKDL